MKALLRRKHHCWSRKKKLIECIFKHCAIKSETDRNLLTQARTKRVNALPLREAATKVGIPYLIAYHIVRLYVSNGHRMTFPTDPPLEKEKKLDQHATSLKLQTSAHAETMVQQEKEYEEEIEVMREQNIRDREEQAATPSGRGT